MAPKVLPGSLPKSVEELKKLLQGSDKGDKGVTGDAIALVPYALRSKAFNGMNKILETTCADQHKVYKDLQNDRGRRNYLAAFILDAESGGANAFHRIC